MLIVLISNLTTVEVITGVILDSYMPTAKWFVGQLPTICCISLILQLCFTPKTLKLWFSRLRVQDWSNLPWTQNVYGVTFASNSQLG